MYYYIKGRLVLLTADLAVVECSGVGYKISISYNTFSQISNLLEKEVTVFTYLNVREDVMELYGFATNEEHHSFSRLIGVSGIGPKAALSILSTLTPGQLMLCVQNGDAKAISRANGVGLKTAQKVIIELKGKLDFDDTGESGEAATVMDDAVNSLAVLGYTKSEILSVLRDMDMTCPLEDILTGALKKLNKF